MVPIPPPSDVQIEAEATRTPIHLSVLVVAGRRLRGVSNAYTRVVILQRRKELSSDKTASSSFGSEPVWSDAPFSFSYADVSKLTLHLMVYSGEGSGHSRLAYSWSEPLSRLRNINGWIDLKPELAAPASAGGGGGGLLIDELPPQLNVAIKFAFRGAPLQLDLIRRHAAKAVDINLFRDGEGRSILSPTTGQAAEWLDALGRRRSTLLTTVRLLVFALILVALFVVPGIMLFPFLEGTL